MHSQLFYILLHHAQSSFLTPQTFLFYSTIFSHSPSIQFVAFLSTQHLSHLIVLFSSPTSPPFSPYVQINSTHSTLLDQPTPSKNQFTFAPHFSIGPYTLLHPLKLIPYIFLLVIMPNLFSSLLKKNLSLKENISLSNFYSSRDFWHLANNIDNNFTSSSFPPLLQPDGPSAVSSLSKVELFAQTFATNSTLDDTGHIPPTPPPSDYFIPEIKIVHHDVFQALSGLDRRKA